MALPSVNSHPSTDIQTAIESAQPHMEPSSLRLHNLIPPALPCSSQVHLKLSLFWWSLLAGAGVPTFWAALNSQRHTLPICRRNAQGQGRLGSRCGARSQHSCPVSLSFCPAPPPCNNTATSTHSVSRLCSPAKLWGPRRWMRLLCRCLQKRERCIRWGTHSTGAPGGKTKHAAVWAGQW